MSVPHVINVVDRAAYAPYYAGTVYYAPYETNLDVYYFPVSVGAEVIYQPFYYYDGELFFSDIEGAPRFFLELHF
jgi:hypothetical protein